ncbi:DUF4388 domain-containing protein [Kitasatospora sp. NPDC052896]|uniref:DUF4388 domain-containing protein n=1 Tax=Kitasatospora sp. NPDC052896 TaxID=3364061 RepID=UPI0037C6AB88
MTPAALLGGQPLTETMERLAGTRATGALHSVAGTVYLAEGAVVHAESTRATGLAALLTTSGRLPVDTWRETLRVFGPEHRVGRMLVERGHLTQGELELCHLVELYDAAFFTLSARSEPVSFEPGAEHWLGPVRTVSARELRHETIRRHDLLERIWPGSQVDIEPVVPIEHPGRAGRRTGPRLGELLDHADGRRTPADLARLLGRSAYATLVDVRRLAAAGLVAGPPAQPASAPRPLSPPDPVPDGSPALQRRTPGASSRRPREPLSGYEPDTALLIRIRTALEARP